MSLNDKSKKFVLFMADIILLYFGLFITIFIRYGSVETINIHAIPFLFVYLVWALVFYIGGLYEVEKFISISSLRNRLANAMLTAGAISILMFYFIQFFSITPKTNLFINVFVAFFVMWYWRKFLFRSAIKSAKTNAYFLGEEKEIQSFAKYINSRPQLGYRTVENINDAEIIIISEESKRNDKHLHELYEMIKNGKTIIDFDRFYESITGKIPVYLISKVWFLENLMELNKQGFENAKRIFDIIFAIILLTPYIIILPIISILIKLTSKGSVFYKQKRVGKNGKIFEIIKFRSMITDAEKNGAQWAKEKDERITFLGNILRKTRIDELPQIWNVLRNDISFVGPRPERPEFVKQLTEQIPHYSMRHLIKPGLSGWAQVNFPYGASVEDATEKLQYELYYIKNRSFWSDISIILKTLMVIFSRAGR